MANEKINRAKQIYELSKKLNEANKLIALGAVTMLSTIQKEKEEQLNKGA